MTRICRFLYDQTRCMGCNACQLACKDKNDLEVGLFFRRVETVRYEKDGVQRSVHYSGACNHCREAACVRACPVGAMVHREDGSVGQEAGRCIGCGACTWACPYGAVKLSRKLGIARKCELCADRRRIGKAPACVDACPTRCLTFEEVEQEDGRELGAGACSKTGGTGELYGEPRLPFLPDPSITSPSLRIRTKGEDPL